MRITLHKLESDGRRLMGDFTTNADGRTGPVRRTAPRKHAPTTQRSRD